MPEAGITPTEQAPAAAIATVPLDGTAPAAVWDDLADALEPSIRAAVRAILARDGPTHHADRADALLEAGMSAETDVMAHTLAIVFAGYDRAPETDAHEAAAELLRAFGQPGIAEPLGQGVPLSAVGDGPVALLEAAEATPTLAIDLQDAFFDQRADQRRDICRLLADLSRVVDVRLLTTGRQRRRLAGLHRAELPGVSDWYSDHRGSGPLAEAVEAARSTLDPDGTAVGILRAIAEVPGETLSYAEIDADPALPAKDTVKYHLSDALVPLHLVERFGPPTDRMVELLAAGRELLDAIDTEAGRQQSFPDLEERVSESGQSHSQAVLSHEHGEGEGAVEDAAAAAAPTATAATEATPYTTTYLDRPAHAAAAGAADSGAVTLVNSRFRAAPDGPDHTRYVSYDGGRDEAVIAVWAAGAMQYGVSTAAALGSPRFLDRALPPKRLEAIDEPPAILRDARCIGGLSEEAVEDGAVLQEALVEWGKTLEDMTTQLRRGEYEDRDRFRSEIMRSAHGLAGTVAHLLDAVGVDLVREIRVPAGLGEKKHAALARSVAVSAAIQSSYGVFASYRQLYEDRDGKRESALSPDVDAADPVGEVIGSYVLRGQDLHRLRPHLEDALATPAELHDDAPEFAVRVPVREAGRETAARTVTRVLDRKRLRPSRAAVSVLAALTASPYATAEALHQLGDAHAPRALRPDELRYALATLDPAALLADCPPTVGRVIAALLRAETRLSQPELADRAGISARSVRRHRGVLEALGVVDVDAGGRWRLRLSFPTAEERRGEGVLPRPVGTEATLAEVVSDVAAALLGPQEYADPGGTVYARLSWPAEPWALLEDSRLEAWVRVAAALVEESRPTDPTIVSMGPQLAQVPLGTDTPIAATPSM